VIIGEERPEKKMLQNKTSRAATKTSTLGVQGKEKKTSSKLTGLTGVQIGLTGVQIGLTGAPSKSENSSTSEVRTRPSFEELLAKNEREEAAQKHKIRPNEAEVANSMSTAGQQLDFRPCQDNCVTMPYSRPLHCFGHIPIITHIWITVGCICNLIMFNILLYIQVVYHHDRVLLVTIWSKEILVAARRVRRT